MITGADRWTLADGEVHPSGYWAEEVAVPHRIFGEAGWNITVATPEARVPTLDQLSLGLAGGLPWKKRAVKDAPAAINAATRPDGTSPFAGYRMTGLSNREELLNSFAKKAPWLLEDGLKELGVIYAKGRIPLRPHIGRPQPLHGPEPGIVRSPG